MTTQYQGELPVPWVVVRAFRSASDGVAGAGVASKAGMRSKRLMGSAPRPHNWVRRPSRSAVILNKQLVRQDRHPLQQQYPLTVTRGGLVHAVHRAARQAQPSGRSGAILQWLWAFATPDPTVYRIQLGRGFDEAAAVLGGDFAGVLVRDGWAPYRRFTAAAHQTCLAHLLRRCRLVAAHHPRTTFATDVQAILQPGLAIRDRHHAGVVSAHGLAVARGHLITRLGGTARPAEPGARRAALRDASQSRVPRDVVLLV